MLQRVADARPGSGLRRPAGLSRGWAGRGMIGRAEGEMLDVTVVLLDADGSAIVVHASPDDHKSQPIGGAGARVACGVVK